MNVRIVYRRMTELHSDMFVNLSEPFCRQLTVDNLTNVLGIIDLSILVK